ncbi:MAG: hypothetical protein K2K47_04120, partial [Duncaniella sp.]|nr:hypothetical protein [Duncaniella sp.]
DADLRERPVECYYIGIANKSRSRLVKENLQQNLVAGAKDNKFSEVGFADRVIIYRQLGVIPAFAVKALDSYDTDYSRWEETKPYGSHWDARLCRRMAEERYSLYPKAAPGEGLMELWINAIIYGIIRYDAASGQYQIKSRGLGGKALKGWMVNMGASRTDAFMFMENNIDVLDSEIKQAIRDMDVPGPENPVRIMSEKAVKSCSDGTYLQEVSKCPIPIETIEHYPAEMDLIEKEIEYILDNLAQ